MVPSERCLTVSRSLTRVPSLLTLTLSSLRIVRSVSQPHTAAAKAKPNTELVNSRMRPITALLSFPLVMDLANAGPRRARPW